MNEPKLIKKSSITDRAINKQRKILIIAVFCVITLFLSSSYALLTNFDKTDNVITIKSGNLTVTVAADTINLNNKLPESDESGLQGTASTITLTNSGTMNIEGYDVKLVSETGTANVTDLDSKYIKYAVSLDGTAYTKPKLLSSNNNIIYTDYNLAVNASKTIYLKVWIDNDAGNNAVNKSFYGSVKVDLYQKKDMVVNEVIKSQIVNNTTSSCPNLTVEEDGITYLSGKSSCINFNYVWYSGKLWRITAINPDGTMKMITDDVITNVSYGNDFNFYDTSKKGDTTYTGSYIYQFLNEDFLDTLYNYSNIITVDNTWNTSTVTTIENKIPTTSLINNTSIGKNTPVGLLNSYEYYLSYKNATSSTGYLNIKYWWWLLNSSADSIPYQINESGASNTEYGSIYGRGVRPSVTLKANIILTGGTGTKDNPYHILGDKEQPTINTTLLNTRTVGEYVLFDEDGISSTKELYRIVGIENGKVKLNKNDYIKSEDTAVLKMFAINVTYGSGTSDDYWDYYLNNTWYNSLSAKNMIESGTYYIKTRKNDVANSSYKNSLCNTDNTTETTKNCTKTTTVWNGYIGLPRYGEMFASQQGSGYADSSYMWLLTPDSSYYVSDIFSVNVSSYNSYTRTLAARPSMYLKSTVKITGGDGTKSNPFTISL